MRIPAQRPGRRASMGKRGGMAMVDTQRSGIFDFARSMGGVPVYVIVGATSAALGPIS